MEFPYTLHPASLKCYHLTSRSVVVKARGLTLTEYLELIFGPYSHFSYCPINILFLVQDPINNLALQKILPYKKVGIERDSEDALFFFLNHLIEVWLTYTKLDRFNV